MGGGRFNPNPRWRIGLSSLARPRVLAYLDSASYGDYNLLGVFKTNPALQT